MSLRVGWPWTPIWVVLLVVLLCCLCLYVLAVWLLGAQGVLAYLIGLACFVRLFVRCGKCFGCVARVVVWVG